MRHLLEFASAPASRRVVIPNHHFFIGREFCNGFAIGIEIVNPGRLLERGTGAVSDFGKVYDVATYNIERAATRAHGAGLWMRYTAEQLAAVEGLVLALSSAYPSITEVVGHHDISPGRKVDPTPFMDWDRMRAALARARPQTIAAAAQPSRDIEALQIQLRALGYYTGMIDGDAGTRTEAALFALQRENGVPTTGRLDRTTCELLDSGAAKPMPTGHREDATAQTLAAGGSQTMASALSDIKDGKAQIVLTTITGTMLAFKQFMHEAGVEIVLGAVVMLGAYYGWKQWKRGGALADHRLAEHQAGLK